MSHSVHAGIHPRADTSPQADGYCSGQYASYCNAFFVLTNSLYPAFPCTSLDTEFCLCGVHTIAARFRVFVVTELSVKRGPTKRPSLGEQNFIPSFDWLWTMYFVPGENKTRRQLVSQLPDLVVIVQNY